MVCIHIILAWNEPTDIGSWDQMPTEVHERIREQWRKNYNSGNNTQNATQMSIALYIYIYMWKTSVRATSIWCIAMFCHRQSASTTRQSTCMCPRRTAGSRKLNVGPNEHSNRKKEKKSGRRMEKKKSKSQPPETQGNLSTGFELCKTQNVCSSNVPPINSLVWRARKAIKKYSHCHCIY